MASPSRRGATGGPSPGIAKIGNAGSAADGAGAADELPVAPGARALRVILVLLLDATLLIWGFYLIRRWATEPAPAVPLATAPATQTQSQTPTPNPNPNPNPNPPPNPPPTPNPNPPPTPNPTPTPTPSPSLQPPPPPRRVTARGPDVLPARGGSLPSKPVDPGVMKNPKPAETASPPAAAAAPPDAPPAPPPVAELPPPEPTPTPTPTPTPPPSSSPPPAETADADGPSAEHPLAAQMTAGIRRVVDGHRPAILDCYRRASKESSPQEPPLQGRLEIHLRILPAGDAEDVRVVQNQTGSEALGDCLVAVMQTWRYPAPGQEAMEFVWPFTFRGRR